jgi:zinc protease
MNILSGWTKPWWLRRNAMTQPHRAAYGTHPATELYGKPRAGWQLALMLLFVAGSGFTSWARPQDTAARLRPHDFVTEQTVAGVKTLVKRRPGSQTVAVGLFFAGGAGHITPAQAGIEALTLAAATQASRHFPRDLLRWETARLGCSLSYLVTYDYSALTLAATRRAFEQSWTLFADVVRYPRFEAEDVTLTRERLVASLLDDEDDPDALLQQVQAKAVYRQHPYAALPHGTPETLEQLGVAEVRAHYARLLTTKRMLLVVVGDVLPRQIAKAAAKLFAGLPAGTPPKPVPPVSWVVPGVTVVNRPLPTDYVQGVYAAPPLTAPDFPALRLAAAILRDRIFEEVRVKRNLSYAPTAFLTAQGANLGGIYVSSVTAQQAVEVMLKEIERLKTELVEPAELRATVAQFLTTTYLAEETNSGQVAALALYELIGGGWRRWGAAMDQLQAVTPEQVQAAARKYMSNLWFVIVGDAGRTRTLCDRLTALTPGPNSK